MTRYAVNITSSAKRAQAARILAAAPFGTRVEFKAAKRSLPQNAKLWSMLSDISCQLQWYGKKLTPDEWKFIFLDALKRELRIVPNLDGTGFVNLGRSSSDLSKSEMSDLIELIAAFGAQNDIQFNDPQTSHGHPQPPTPSPETLPAAAAAAQREAAAGPYSEASHAS